MSGQSRLRFLLFGNERSRDNSQTVRGSLKFREHEHSRCRVSAYVTRCPLVISSSSTVRDALLCRTSRWPSRLGSRGPTTAGVLADACRNSDPSNMKQSTEPRSQRPKTPGQQGPGQSRHRYQHHKHLAPKPLAISQPARNLSNKISQTTASHSVNNTSPTASSAP